MIEDVVISGRRLTEEDIDTAVFVVETYKKLSRKELASTVCECLEWVTHKNDPKVTEGLKLLEYLEKEGMVILPPKNEKMAQNARGGMRALAITNRTDPPPDITGEISDHKPIELKVVINKDDFELWREYIERYHPLKYAKPFGSNIKYLIKSKDRVLGCMLFSAPAWALEDRDKWIGWTAEDRAKRLVYVVNNTRYLLLPWVKINNLASHVLGKAVKQLPKDWFEHNNCELVLLETFVDIAEYKGTCYKASNWIKVGTSKGRGRQDKHNQYLSSPKDIYMYPLRNDFRKYLTGELEPVIRKDEWDV